MKIFVYTETRCPRRSQAGASDKRQTRARRRVTRPNSKKVAPTRPGVPLPFPLYIEALFPMPPTEVSELLDYPEAARFSER